VRQFKSLITPEGQIDENQLDAFVEMDEKENADMV